MKQQIFHRGGRVLAGALLAAGLSTGAGAWAQAADAPPGERVREQAQEQARVSEQAPVENREQVYGWQLMTPEERQAIRARMRKADSAEERARIRAEHHALMQARARERGVELPPAPRDRGAGMGSGRGQRKGPMGDDSGRHQGRNSN